MKLAIWGQWRFVVVTAIEGFSPKGYWREEPENTKPAHSSKTTRKSSDDRPCFEGTHFIVGELEWSMSSVADGVEFLFHLLATHRCRGLGPAWSLFRTMPHMFVSIFSLQTLFYFSKKLKTWYERGKIELGAKTKKLSDWSCIHPIKNDVFFLKNPRSSFSFIDKTWPCFVL